MTEHTIRVSVRQALSAHLPSPNDVTSAGALRRVGSSAADAFNAHHEAIRRELQRWRGRGVGFCAVSRMGLHGWGWAAAGETFRAVCIGRHSSSHLHLPREVGLSLRHVLVVLGRRRDAWGARIFDLSTRWGFADEAGARRRGLVFDRVAILQVAELWLFVMVTGDELPWDPTAVNPFGTLPPRTPRATTDEQRPCVQRAPPEKDPCLSCVEGPMAFTSGDLVGPGERPDGVLLLQAPGGVARLPVGPRALERGVLLGRDARCGVLGFGLPQGVSRVRALALGLNGGVYLTDAGSTNRVWRDDQAVRIEEMRPDRRFLFGGHATSARWISTH